MRPARFIDDEGACGDAPARERGLSRRIENKLLAFIETTKPQNLTDMEWINTLQGFENFRKLEYIEPSLKKEVSDLLLKIRFEMVI